MYTRKYIAVVISITCLALLAAFLLWDSEDAKVVDIGPISAGAFVRGDIDAPVTIDTYIDFT